MKTSLILTLLGPDRPGLIEEVADTIARHDGNWQESRMSKLSGHFAGLLRAEIPTDHLTALEKELSDLSSRGLQIAIASDQPCDTESASILKLDIIGHDQPGIVKRITSTLASHSANVIELETSLESAPMAGHQLFRTEGTVSLKDETSLNNLVAALEQLGPDLSVTIS